MQWTHDADVLIIGAGTGGLTTAAYLAAAGRRVLVVDPGPRPGGHGTVFERGGYEFDIGLHYVGSSQHGRPAPDAMLDPLGIALEWNRIDPSDTIVLDDGSTFRVPIGAEAYRQALHEALPAERAAVERFVDAIVGLDHDMTTLIATRGITDLPAAIRSLLPLARHRTTTLGETFDQLRCSPKARLLMGWIAGTYGLPPSETPLLVHTLATMHYIRGAWYPRGGGSVIADRLADVIRSHGGEFLLQHRVTGITVRGGAVVGATAIGPDGPVELRAPVVVSGADIKHTYLDLLDPTVVPEPLRRKVRGYEMSLPLGVLYTVIDRDLRAEGVPATNYLTSGESIEDVARAAQAGRFSQRPIVWVTSASLKDPDNERLCGPGQTNVQLMTIVPPQPAAWGLQEGVERGDAYRAAKQALRDRLVAGAERAIPGFGEAVVFEDLATPATFTRYTGTSDGSSYGIALTADQFALGRPGPKTHIKGLFLVGASTRTGHGIAAVMVGGTVTATAVLGSSAAGAVQRRGTRSSPAAAQPGEPSQALHS